MKGGTCPLSSAIVSEKVVLDGSIVGPDWDDIRPLLLLIDEHQNELLDGRL